MGICCMAEETQSGALYQPRGVGLGGRWEGGSKGRGYTYAYLWLIHVEVWQKAAKFCKAVILRLKINFKNLKMKRNNILKVTGIYVWIE